jgi:hypothetical protein
MNNWYMHLKLPFEVDLREHAMFGDPLSKSLGHSPIDKTVLGEELLTLLADREIDISHSEAFHTPPKTQLPIHIDHDTIGNHVKMNFCYGAPGSKMIWWTLKDPTKVPAYRYSTIGTKYIGFSMSECRTVKQTEIGRPTLVNIGQPHSVINTTNEHRWVISVVLWDKRNSCRLEMPEAHERFKDLAL